MTQDGKKKEIKELPEHLQWKGEGPAPAYWWAFGVKVYRSYEDYCND